MSDTWEDTSRKSISARGSTTHLFQPGQRTWVYRESGGDWFEGDVIDIVRGPGKKKYKVRFLGESEIFEVFENFILLKSDSFPKPLSTVGVGHEDSGFSVGEACEVHVPTKNIWIPAKIVEVHASADSKQVAYYQIESQGKLLSVRPAHLRRIVTEVKESVPTGWYEGQSVMLKPPGHTAWVRGKITEVLLEQSPTKYRVEFKKRAKTEILLMDCVVDEETCKNTLPSNVLIAISPIAREDVVGTLPDNAERFRIIL